MFGAALRGLLCASLVVAALASAVDDAGPPAAVAALAANDECAAAGGAEAGGGCAVSALQRHARSVLKARQEPQAAVAAWGQCGGVVGTAAGTTAYDGPTSCVPGYTCVVDSQWYSQCKPKGSLKTKSVGEDEPDGGDKEEPDDDGDKEEPDDNGDEQEPDDNSSEEEPDDKGDEEEPDDDSSEEEPDDKGDEGTPQQQPVPLKPNPPMPTPKKFASLNPIVIKGNFLYDSVTGKRFFAKGVAYNPRSIRYDAGWGRSKNCTPGEPKHPQLSYDADVIADELEDMWRPALKAIANLGANTIRIYNIDPMNNHSKFMQAAAELGLYVIVPLTRKAYGFLPAFPAPDCYAKDIENYGNVGVNLLTTGKLVVKEFSHWNNTLMFTIANEMTVNDKNGFAAFPCVKAYTRDIHRYQESCGSNMRRVPLIYADMDIGNDRTIIADYMACELESADDAVDAYGINVYSWCDPSYPDGTGKDNFNYSPYYDIMKGFKHFQRPVLFTEFGCNIGAFETHCPYEGGRTWPQVKTIVGTMGEVLSGAIAFEFSMEENEFGLALTPGFLAGQDDLYLLDNYFALQKQFKKYNVSDAWDAKAAAPEEAMADCKWTPAEVAPLSVTHEASGCPAAPVYKSLQEKRRVDTVVSWRELPPTPRAPLSDVNNQSECPASNVTPIVYRENCCHMTSCDLGWYYVPPFR